MGKLVARGREGVGRLYAAALLGLMLLLVVAAYSPFRWDPPRMVRNDVTRGAHGALRFGEMNRARTPAAPRWLADARRTGRLEIDLQVDPRSTRQSAASMVMVARDYWHTDIAIGQDHSDLLVWLQRPGADSNGNPSFVVGEALRARRWEHVAVVLRGDGLRIDVNGQRRLSERLPARTFTTWGPGLVALGDEVHGGGPWRGRIRQAVVRTPGHVVDYVRAGALSIPARYLYFPDHVAPFPPVGAGEWEAAVLHLLSFVPFGFLLVRCRRPPLPPVPATVLAAAFAVALAAGKLLFHSRHAEALDIVVQTSGASLGALLAWRWARRQVAAPRIQRVGP